MEIETTNHDEQHKRRSQKRKEAFEKRLAAATREKGLLIVNTGTGKGKTTAAFGMGLRVLGHGMKLGVVQFIKGALHSAEREVLGKHPNCEFHTAGEGYTWETQNREGDVTAAKNGWDQAVRMINNPAFDMVILDELNVILKYRYLDTREVIAALRKRPSGQHVVITGRHAPPELVDIADLVSEMQAIKHPYREQGIKAQKGVEY